MVHIEIQSAYHVWVWHVGVAYGCGLCTHPYRELCSAAINDQRLYLEINTCTAAEECITVVTQQRQTDLPIVADTSGSNVSFVNLSSKLRDEVEGGS